MFGNLDRFFINGSAKDCTTGRGTMLRVGSAEAVKRKHHPSGRKHQGTNQLPSAITSANPQVKGFAAELIDSVMFLQVCVRRLLQMPEA